MSYNKTHQIAGRNAARHSGGIPSRKNSPAPPRSTLANLLSSQRRSAVQSDRYRVQQARPFADRTHIDQAVEKRDVNQSKSSQEKGKGDNSRQALLKGSINLGPSAPSSDRRSTVPYIHESKTENPSRRVRFSTPSDSKEIKSEGIPQRKSRWGERPSSVQSTSLSREDEAISATLTQGQQQNQSALENKRKLSAIKATLVPPSESIPKKRGRSEGKACDTQQKFISKNSIAPYATSKRRDGQSAETNKSEISCPRSLNALETPFQNDFGTETGPVSGGNIHSCSTSRQEESILHTTSVKNSITDAALKFRSGLKKSGGHALTLSATDEKMPNNLSVEAKESGINVQSKRDETFHDSSVEPLTINKQNSAMQEGASMKLPKSKKQKRRSKERERESAVSREGSPRFQNSSIKLTLMENAAPMKSSKSKTKRRKSKESNPESLKRECAVSWGDRPRFQESSTEPTMMEDKKLALQNAIPMKSSKSKTKRRRRSEVREQDDSPERENAFSGEESPNFRNSSAESMMVAEDQESAFQNATSMKSRKSKIKQRRSKEREQDPPKREGAVSGEESPRDEGSSADSMTAEDQESTFQNAIPKKSRKSKNKQRRRQIREQDDSPKRECASPRRYKSSIESMMAEDQESALQNDIPKKSRKSKSKQRKSELSEQDDSPEQVSAVSGEESPRLYKSSTESMVVTEDQGSALQSAISMMSRKSKSKQRKSEEREHNSPEREMSGEDSLRVQGSSTESMMAEDQESALQNATPKKSRKSKSKCRRSEEREQDSHKREHLVSGEGSPRLYSSSKESTMAEDQESALQNDVFLMKSSKLKTKRRKSKEREYLIPEREHLVSGEGSPRFQYSSIETTIVEKKQLTLQLQNDVPTKPLKSNSKRRKSKERDKDSPEQDNVASTIGSYESSIETTIKEDEDSPPQIAIQTKPPKSKRRKSKEREIGSIPKLESAVLREGSPMCHDISIKPTMVEGKESTLQNAVSKKSRKSKSERRRSKEEQDSIPKLESTVLREGSPRFYDSFTDPTLVEGKESDFENFVPKKSGKSKSKRRRSKEREQDSIRRPESLASKEGSPNGKYDKIEPSLAEDKNPTLLKGPGLKTERRRMSEIEVVKQDSTPDRESTISREFSLKANRDGNVDKSSEEPTIVKDEKSALQNVAETKSLESKIERRSTQVMRQKSIPEGENSVSKDGRRRSKDTEKVFDSSMEPTMANDKNSTLQRPPQSKIDQRSSKLMKLDSILEQENRDSNECQRGKPDETLCDSSTELSAVQDKNSLLQNLSLVKLPQSSTEPKSNEVTRHDSLKREEVVSKRDSWRLKEEGKINEPPSIGPAMVNDETSAIQKIDSVAPSLLIVPTSCRIMKQVSMEDSPRLEADEKMCDSSTEPTFVEDKKPLLQKTSPMKSPKSIIEPRPRKEIQRDSLPQQHILVPIEGVSRMEQNSPAREKLDEDRSKEGNAYVSNNAEVTPLALEPKSRLREDAATSPSVLPKKKRKKDFSPFRVKVGCVVAVRFRKLSDGGNLEVVPVVKDGDSFHAIEPTLETSAAPKQPNGSDQNGDATDLSENGHNYGSLVATTPNKKKESLTKDKSTTKRVPSHYEVWSDPIPGQDDGISLLGSWIRCVFPKSFIAHWHKRNKSGNQSSSGRILEGNVISILENNHDSTKGITVCLLVDHTSIKSLPYLQVVPDESSEAAISSTKQKRRKLEALIRGENKVVVTVVLASVFDQRNGSKFALGVVSQWVVRKRVVAKPAGKKPSKSEIYRNKQRAQSLFVGDGNDAQSRQAENWRWIASRTAGQLIGASTPPLVTGTNVQDPASQLVGEVIKIDVSPKETQSASSTSLATVTIKRLWTPEQTSCGRLAHHRPLELFDPGHDNGNELRFQAPIENLIVIGKCINRIYGAEKQLNYGRSEGDDPGWNFTITHSYHDGDNKYVPLGENVNATMLGETCHYCQEETKPIELKTSMVSYSTQNGIGQSFSDLITSLKSKSCMDFTLPNRIGQLTLQPSFLPITGVMKSKSYTKSKEGKPSHLKHGKRKKRASTDTGVKSRKKLKAELSAEAQREDDDDNFKRVCSRTVSFEQFNKTCWGSSKRRPAADDTKQPFFRENSRPRIIKVGKTEEKTTLTGRAARANQRRMFKSLDALGDSTKKVDRLAGRDREQQLRFDKSKIHGWGVFAEQPINAGDLIIEYRGEIIGNAVSDKRELEYQRAKLDDYMFRIDAYEVCDATILGNVARYINSSCSPNCYTQIITAGENKRIVIYAKRDIQLGEELYYDYKFSLEYDPAKRIPCNCGSNDCRGFMNWDKKYL